MKVRVTRCEWRRGNDTAVVFGIVAHREVYALMGVLEVLDLNVRLEKTPDHYLDIILPDNKVAVLPK